MKRKLGSEQYPVRLTSHISEHEKNKRKLLNEDHIRFPHEGGTRIDFERLPDIYLNGFVENVIGNPNLSALEVKVALFLSQRASDTELGILCRADESIEVSELPKLIGEDGDLHYGYDIHNYFFLKETIDLRDELRKLHINVTEVELSLILTRLHDFSYITVTDVCWDNIQKRAPQKPADLSKDELKLVYCRSIKVFPYMDTRAVFKYWKKESA
ncbi:hypothetical protein AB4238_00535 [Shewanella sp. 10N.286.45.A1]|uniref:hypothetical protein n=1 Tax=Shewanella sp. 10N.286.45.A1 TaxID=3229694 RepID=UPI00354C622B